MRGGRQREEETEGGGDRGRRRKEVKCLASFGIADISCKMGSLVSGKV